MAVQLNPFQLIQDFAKQYYAKDPNLQKLLPEQKKPIQDRLPQDDSLPESPSRTQLTPAGTPLHLPPGGQTEAHFPPVRGSLSLGDTLYGPDVDPTTTPSPQTAQGQSVSSPSQVPVQPQQEDPNMVLKRFMLQAGLNLMAGGWGNPLSRIANAVGAGAEAQQRHEKIQEDKRANQSALSFKQRQLDINQQAADASSLRAVAAMESSRSKRLGSRKKNDSIDDAVSGMTPEAQVYFRTRMKGFNKMLEPDSLNPDATPKDPQQTYQQIINETTQVDLRTRAARGQLKSDEVSEEAIKTVVAQPELEQRLLDQVRSDPIQLGLLRKRLEVARSQSNAAR